MYLRWKVRRRPYWYGQEYSVLGDRDEAVLYTAVLVTNTRVNGHPRQHYVATLGSLDAGWLQRPPTCRDERNYARQAAHKRLEFWKPLRLRLAGLVDAGTITEDQRERFEQQITLRVPLPTEEVLATADKDMREWYARTPEEDEAHKRAARAMWTALTGYRWD
jgi:hypothetical protein